MIAIEKKNIHPVMAIGKITQETVLRNPNLTMNVFS
jgi:hypothetical protein